MKTQAQQAFDADYRIMRHLFITCKNVNGGVAGIKAWIQEMGQVAMIESKYEIHSDRFSKRLARPSGFERDEMLFLSHLNNLETSEV